MKIVVVPATYNEAENIEKFIITLEEEVFPKIKGHELFLLIADDFSPDGTGDIVKKLMKKYKNLDINEGPKKGLGAAYLRAMTYAIDKYNADVVVSIDADFQFDPHDLPKFINKIEEGYDMVVQSRYSGGGSIPHNWPIQRKVFSITANLFVRSVFMRFFIHDWTGGFRAIKKEVYEKVAPEMKGYNGYIFQIAFLHKAVQKGFKVGEVPLHFSDRKLGMSKIAPMGYIMNVLNYVLSARVNEVGRGPFGKFIIVGGFGFILNAIILRVLVDGFGWIPYLANLVGAAVAIFSNYNFNNFWSFKHHKAHNVFHYFLKMFQFYLTSAFGVTVIQTGTIYVGTHFITNNDDYFYYFLLGTSFLLVWNFSIYSRVIWRKKH